MSDALKFDDEQTRRLVAMYTTPDVAVQREYTVRLLNLQPGEHVLDIGSGPGLLTRSMAEMVADNGAVHGIDVSESMLALAEQRCADQSWVTFHNADATDLPFDDDTFDVAVTTQVYEYIEDVEAAVAELFRVLRPGGRALILDTDWDAVVWHTSDLERMARIMRAWEAHCAHPRLPRYLNPMLRKVGFIITAHDVHVIVNTEYNDNTYGYDDKGQLVSLTDWDSQQTRFAHDGAGRHVLTERSNGLDSRYYYDTAGRLRRLSHVRGFKTIAEFKYAVDGRGNRTQATELLMHPATTNDITLLFDDPTVVYKGSWSDASPFKETTRFSAALKLVFAGDEVTFTYGTGPDHSIFDVYIGETFFQSYDGYAASSGEQSVTINLKGEGPHLFEIRNRNEQNLSSTGLKLRFKQVVMPDVSYDLHTIEYDYDALSRLLEARYNPGEAIDLPDADLLRRYLFTFDLAGNRLSESVAIDGGAPTVTNYIYNAANQLTSDGTNTLTYDDNGNLTNDGTDTYSWDRVNRLTSVGNHSYKYDGLGHRYQQTVSSVVTDYLLDLQPGLAVVLSTDDGTNTERFIHAQRGILARENNAGDWFWTVQDALGSVRGEVDSNVAVQGARHFAPIGSEFGLQGSIDTVFGFTGEQTDGNELLFLRARYYAPELGVFASLDPDEGCTSRAMSLNGYSWVEGNFVNLIDPTGEFAQLGQLNNSAITASILNSNLCALQPCYLAGLSGCEACICDYQFLVPQRPGVPPPISVEEFCVGVCSSPATPTPSPLPLPSPSQFTITPGGNAPGRLAYSGGCIENDTTPAARQACAILAYNEALNRLGGSMTWDELIALTIQAEGGTIYELTHGINADCRPNQDCDDVRELFERAVIRNLTRACGDSTTCTSQQFLDFIGEAQAWYTPGRQTGRVNLTDFDRLFGGERYRDFIDVLGRWWSSNVQQGCQTFACSWGNCKRDLRTDENVPEELRWIVFQDPTADFHIQEPNPLPGQVIFIVGTYLPCNFG